MEMEKVELQIPEFLTTSTLTVCLVHEIKGKVLPKPAPPPIGLQSEIQPPTPPHQPHTQVTHSHTQKQEFVL